MARRPSGQGSSNQTLFESAGLATPSGSGRKRVSRACERCKVKKVKCCGSNPCTRCQLDDVVCYFGSRGKVEEGPVPAARVNQLEVQQNVLIKALRVLWKRCNAGDSDPTSPPQAEPSIHEIVKATGVLSEPRDPAMMENGVDFDNLFINALDDEVKYDKEMNDAMGNDFSAHQDTSSTVTIQQFTNGTQQSQDYNEYVRDKFTFVEPFTPSHYGRDTTMTQIADSGTNYTQPGIHNDLYVRTSSNHYQSPGIAPENIPEPPSGDQMWPWHANGQLAEAKSTYDYDCLFEFTTIGNETSY